MIPARATGARSTQNSVSIPVHCCKCGQMIKRDRGGSRWNNKFQIHLRQATVCGKCSVK